MTKQSLLHNIAQTAYDIGFGGKRHFKTFDIYRTTPKTVSLLTIIVGICQLLDVYKRHATPDLTDTISVMLIVIGIIALVIDIFGENKDKYEHAGKELLKHFNRLRRMYYEVHSMDDTCDFSAIYEKLEEIAEEASSVSLSKQAIFTHWSTHIGFFKGMQSDWIVKELKLGWSDRNPVWHWETVFWVFLIALVVVAAIHLL